MRSEFLLALQQIADDKGLQIDAVLNALGTAVKFAFLDLGTEYEDVEVEIDPDTGGATVYANKTVVQSVDDQLREISLVEARKFDDSVELSEIFQIDITPPNFGRIATQRARQVMQQALRDAERLEVYTQFIEHEGEILVGRVTRVENRGAYVELGRAEAVMTPQDQIPGEYYRAGQRLRVLLLQVGEGGRGAQLLVSRAHPDFVRRLFEREVPEIQSGLVEIMGIAREPGVRTKVAVRAMQDGLDPVGSCVGVRGTRIQNVLRELGEEKVEIILWDGESRVYVANALSPAKVETVHIDVAERVADVFVGTNMVSLAIGREGQNSRLAARLTGFRINIRDASAPAETRNVAAPDAEPATSESVAPAEAQDVEASVAEADASGSVESDASNKSAEDGDDAPPAVDAGETEAGDATAPDPAPSEPENTEADLVPAKRAGEPEPERSSAEA